MFLISSNTSIIWSYLSAVQKRNIDNTNLLEIKQTEQLTDIQIFQMTWWKGKKILHKWYSMDKLLYSKNIMEFHLNYEWLLEDKHLLAKEN